MNRATASTLLIQHMPFLRGYARKITYANYTDAQDLLQQTCLRVLEACEQFKEGSIFKAWACVIMYHIHTNMLRERNRLTYTDILPDIAIPPVADNHIEFSETCSMFESLSDHFKEMIIDVALGLEYSEIATKRSIVLGTAKSRVCRARDKLKQLCPLQMPN